MLSYTFPQKIDSDNQLLEGALEDTGSTWDGKPLVDTPFVKQCLLRHHSLVQVWPTKFNDKFKQDFTCSELNPDIRKFEAAAISDFKSCIEEMFGEDATKKVRIQYCQKKTQNRFPCYLGKTEQLLKYFKDNERDMEEVQIRKLLPDGFVAGGENESGS